MLKKKGVLSHVMDFAHEGRKVFFYRRRISRSFQNEITVPTYDLPCTFQVLTAFYNGNLFWYHQMICIPKAISVYYHILKLGNP